MSVLRIYNNPLAINANRNLKITGMAISKSLERLASGLRINRAADDAAGLSISEKLRAQIRGLNRTYRGLDQPTDVLSFPMHGRKRPLRGTLLLGDVVISTDMVRRQASTEGVALIAVAERLLIHGLLHLLGYDHEISEAEARRMERRERMLAVSIRRPAHAR